MKVVSVLTIAAALVAAAPTPAPNPAVVRLGSGSIEGIKQGKVSAFLGIPFAKPPVGPLRWRAPQPVVRWQGVRPAKAPAAACYQSPPRAFGPYTEEFLTHGPVSEDCLYLNVWTPAPGTARRPVFVYIHGGGFGSGSGSMPIYDGAKLAAGNAVVVTINYRLGVFGFMAHPELTRESGHSTSGNYGLLDMIAALQWVRANIAKFGGDPNNVTIGGESAGAAAVNDLIVSPQAKGLFQRAMAISGSGLGLRMPTLAKAETYGVDLAARVGAPSIAALRQLSAEALQEASAVAPPTGGKHPTVPDIRFAPNNDGVVVLRDPDAGRGAIVSNVPLLTGFNADEGTAFGVPTTPAEFEEMVRNRYDTFADQFLALYPHATPAEVATSAVAIARDRYMANLIVWAHERIAASGEPVYGYLYDHPYPPAAGGPAFGAFHTASIPYLFGNLGLGPRRFDTTDRAISDLWQAHLLAFMRSGDPSTTGAPWPRISPDGADVMAIGDGSGPRPAVSSAERFQAFRAYLAAGGKLSLF